MRKIILPLILLVIPFRVVYSQESDERIHRCDGGMMLHTGFLSGNIDPLGYKASGMPIGVGGVVRYHLGKHWRIGAEGYVSTLSQMGNGSYVKYGWGGLLGDFSWTLGKFMPYAGLTLGGGATTDLLIMKESEEEWKPVQETYYHKQGFFAIDPFIGCDYILSSAVHLTLKVDFLAGIGNELQMPIGPRLYFGIIFYH